MMLFGQLLINNRHTFAFVAKLTYKICVKISSIINLQTLTLPKVPYVAPNVRNCI